MLPTNKNGLVYVDDDTLRLLIGLSDTINQHPLLDKRYGRYYTSDDFWSHYMDQINPKKMQALEKREYFVSIGVPAICVQAATYIRTYGHEGIKERVGLVVNAISRRLFFYDDVAEPVYHNHLDGNSFTAIADPLSQSWQVVK